MTNGLPTKSPFMLQRAFLPIRKLGDSGSNLNFYNNLKMHHSGLSVNSATASDWCCPTRHSQKQQDKGWPRMAERNSPTRVLQTLHVLSWCECPRRTSILSNHVLWNCILMEIIAHPPLTRHAPMRIALSPLLGLCHQPCATACFAPMST